MRRLRPSWAVLIATLLSLAGCSNGGSDDGGDGESDGPGTGGGVDGGLTSRPGHAGEEDPLDRFAVLVVDGRLDGRGPPPNPVVACDLAAPDGQLDLDGKHAWAKPGQHSFEAGETWILVLDRVVVDDPRGGCQVRKVTPFTFDAEWTPQVQADFRLHVFSDGDDLLVGKNGLSPGGDFDVRVEFEDEEYTFTGNVTFTHAGWWPLSAFEEREEEAPPDDAGSVWWD